MKILESSIMPDGICVQIEEWRENYSFIPYGSTVATYPISLWSHKGSYSPKSGEIFRCSFDFQSYEEAKEAYGNLKNGSKSLVDYAKHMTDKKYISCITGKDRC